MKAKIKECKASLGHSSPYLHLESALLYLQAGMPKKAADMLVSFSALNPPYQVRILKLAADLYLVSSLKKWASTYILYLESLDEDKLDSFEKLQIHAAASFMKKLDFISAAASFEDAANFTCSKQRKMIYFIEAERLYEKAGLRNHAQRIYNQTLFMLYSK
ncbi:MAG: hypothetical protein QXT25_03190 [Candidatus Anstonellaceae archaeon]